MWELEPGAIPVEQTSLPQLNVFDPPRVFDAFLDAVAWGSVSSADDKALQAPFRSGVEVDDYQLDLVVRALSMPRVNLLIADDVGLGKTIEAGLVMQELILRHRARSILIVCPSSIQVQWKEELRDKFGLEFRIVDSNLLADLRRRRGIHVNPWAHFPRLITSIDFLKRERNAMTHGKWGEMSTGALNFDFVDRKGVAHRATFTSPQVMAWVEAVSQIASMLLVPATATAKSIKAVKRKLNLLQPHHGGAFFLPPGLRSFRVVRRTEVAAPVMVDMQNIRLRVEQHSTGKPYEIELRIESGKEGNRDCWEIPPEHIPTSDFLLDSTFDCFKVNP